MRRAGIPWGAGGCPRHQGEKIERVQEGLSERVKWATCPISGRKGL
jgi:hypothetical protein